VNLTEKILAYHAGKDDVVPGEFINVKVDMVLSNDITAPIAIREFRKLGIKKVFDPQKVVMVADHFTPNKDIKSAEQAKVVREFANEQGIIHYDVGRMGIEHILLHEEGLVLPGDVVRDMDESTAD
jgi:3-isopropylmalate/(R)-2-methylmalate dehydratase large subunit